jgi:ankyrin repeat protein
MAMKPVQTPKSYRMADIFHAAKVDDVAELMEALADGQRLDTRLPKQLNMTPLHLACLSASNEFIKVAVDQESCDPWLRDDNARVAFDHAAAFNNKTAMLLTLRAMYPAPI